MKKKWLIYRDDMIVITDNSDTDSHVTFIKHDLDTETCKLIVAQYGTSYTIA